MLAESHPLVRRTLRFCALPYCYFSLIDWNECTASRGQVAKDLLYIFFRLKYFPDNYSACRFWEKDRKEWSYYYGSSYHSYQRQKLRKEVQTFERQIVFNDKMICEQLCKGMNIRMPRSFGAITPGSSYRKKIEELHQQTGLKRLIVKPVLGHAGRGIVLSIQNEGKVMIQKGGGQIPLHDFELVDEAIIQEVVTQCEEISDIASASVNTIRVLTLLTRDHEVIPISSSMRFGVGDAYVDNWSSGGIAVGVDHTTGRLKEIAYDKLGKQYRKHPVSNFQFNDFQVPMWEEVLSVASAVQHACTFYKLLGMDIALSKEGPILIEVNANPDIVFQEQTAGPLFKDQKVLREFARYDLLMNGFQQALLKSVSKERNGDLLAEPGA